MDLIYTWAVQENIVKENITTSNITYTDANVDYINNINNTYYNIIYILLFWLTLIYLKKWIYKFLNLFNKKIW